MLFANKKLCGILTAVILSSALMTGCATQPKQESVGQVIDSSVITTKVKSELLADKQVSGLPISVKTYKNTVQLSGFVNSAAQKERAEQIARSVEGVQYIKNSLLVKAR